MKKLLLMFAVMLSTVGAWAQNVVTSTDANPKYYVIASYNRGGYLTNAGVGSGLTHDDLSDAGFWYFEKANDNGGVYIVNKVKDGESKVYVGSDKTASTTSAVWYVLENGVNKKGFSISSTNPISGGSCIDANNYNTGVGSWNPSTSDWHGTTWVVCSTEDNTYNPENLIFRTRSDRYVTSISLESTMSAATPGNSTTINRDFTGDNGLAYIDLTGSVTMKAVAGETVTASIARNGGWTNAYVYIDKDADGFTASYDTEAKTFGGDLMTFSFYSGDEADDVTGVNSAGNELTTSARNTIAMPSFQAPSTPGKYRMRFKHDWNSINPNGGNANFNSNGGSIIDVTLEVVSSTIEVNYSFTWKGVEKFTQTATTIVGDEYPAITTTFPFGVSATKPEGTITELDVVDGKVNKTIELELNLPFIPAADNASIEHWYYIQMHSSPSLSKYIQYMDTYIEWLDTDIDAADKDSYTWAFVGNPFDGFKLVNMKAGINKAVNANGSGNPTVGDYETGVIWEIKNSRTNNDSEHFCFKFPGGNYMNAQNGKVAFWYDNDQGSTMWVTERNFAITADLEELVEKASAITDGTTGTTVGYYTQASVEELQAAINEANAVIGGEPTQDKVNELEAKITNAMAALKIVLPEKGKFYNIVSANTSYAAGKQIYVSDDAGLKFDTPTGKNIGNVFQFVPVEDQEDQFYVYNVERGLYLSTNKAHANGQQKAEFAITNLAKPITIANMGSENIVKLTPVGGAMIHAQQANSVVVAWDNNDYTSASAWKIVEVEDMTTQLHTLKVGELGYSTIYLAYDAVIPAFEGDNGVYVAEQVNAEGTAMNLRKIEGVLPANTGAIVKAPQGEYEFAYSEAAGTETSMLKGSTSDKNIVATANKNHYILSHEEGVVAFFKTTTSVLELDGEYVNIFFNHAFKAYLPIEQGSAARSLVFNFGGETGIHDIESGDLNGGNAEIYDLSGRRVQKAQKGLYIINGKKVVR